MQKKVLALVLLLPFLVGCSVDTEYHECDLNKDGEIKDVERELCIELDLEEEEGEKLTKLQGAFVVIHHEVGNYGVDSTLYPEKYWSTTKDVVKLADEYEFHLNLAFNPTWGEYIIQEDLLDEVREWEKNGHELMVHNHGITHGGWNGFTNDDSYIKEKKYRGTIEDMMEILNQLPESGQMVSIAGTDLEYDLPKGVFYEVEGGALSDTPLLHQPERVEYEVGTVTQVHHTAYISGGSEGVEIDQVEVGLIEAEEGDYLGITFHEFNFEEEPEKVESLFELFDEYNVDVITVQEALN